MKFDITATTQKFLPLLTFIKRYAVFIFIVGLLCVYVYLVHHIGQLIQNEPVQTSSDSAVKPVSRLKIDKEAVKVITDLEAQNVEVKSLFEQARQNPFTE